MHSAYWYIFVMFRSIQYSSHLFIVGSLALLFTQYFSRYILSPSICCIHWSLEVTFFASSFPEQTKKIRFPSEISDEIRKYCCWLYQRTKYQSFVLRKKEVKVPKNLLPAQNFISIFLLTTLSHKIQHNFFFDVSRYQNTRKWQDLKY